MKLISLELKDKDFFKKASELETAFPKGEWRFFDFISIDCVRALYQHEKLSEKNSFKPHKDFFEVFLGLFTPQIESSFDIFQEKTFPEYCIKLNNLLNENKAILDHSNKDLWIWAQGTSFTCPPDLKKYLD